LHLGENTPDDASPAYDYFRPNFVFGALDAVQWLLSSANPRRALIDRSRVAVAGHSAGADGALVTVGVDPKRRFKAAVALDDFGVPPAGWRARVPTMIQQSELQADLGPYLSRPPANYFPSSRTYRRLTQAGVPAQLVALRASSHSDWIYIPESLINPYGTPFGNQSRYGERVGAYYAVAWLDRWLSGSASAGARLRSCVFDGSVDASSIGVGTYSVRAHSNAPYRIKGRTAADSLSTITASRLDFGGHHSGDLQAACAG
jgi:hypothetical protein